MFFIYIIAFCIGLIIIVSLVKIKVVIKVDNNSIFITIIILAVIKIHLNFIIKRVKDDIFTLYKVKKKKTIKVKSLKEILQETKKTHITDRQKITRKKAMKFLYNKSRIFISIELKTGLNNAYATAMACGFFNIIYSITGNIYNNTKRKIIIKIKPLFSKLLFSIKADCIIELSPANIIIGYILYKKK